MAAPSTQTAAHTLLLINQLTLPPFFPLPPSPQISLARERQDALRRRAEVALQQSGLGEASHQSVGSLGEAHALIAVLQDRLKAAEAAPRRKGSRSGAPAAAQPVLDPDL